MFGLHPLFRFEDNVQPDRQGDHRAHSQGVSEGPVQLGHDIEVHAIDCTYQGGCEEDRCPAGDLFMSSFCRWATRVEFTLRICESASRSSDTRVLAWVR